MSLQGERPENENKAANPEPVNQQKPDKENQDKDELSEESLEEVSGGMLPTYKPFYVPPYVKP